MNHFIEIKNLNKFYGKKQALYDVNLSIHPGMFGLLGVSALQQGAYQNKRTGCPIPN